MLQKLFENSKFFALKAQADGSLWEQADRIRVLKGREESWRPFRTPELTACRPDVLRLATILLLRCGRSGFSNSFSDWFTSPWV